ncbi:hypothetical protein [Streptomyces sp. NPDC059063]|uniref:hypothetical protein n=1 Tax=unclassified Streptomyces TaxID=2593676 RepID=UPI00369E1420
MTGKEWWLPVVVCAAVTWVALLVRFWGEGRLLGTWMSRWCAMVFVAWTALLAGMASFWLTPYASHVPPAIVGAVVGWALVSSVGKEQERQMQTAPLVKLLTLYDSVLLERLAEQLKDDEATWCEGLAQGFCESFELQCFIDDIQKRLLLRVDVAGRPVQRQKRLRQHINERHSEAQNAVNEWATQEKLRGYGGTLTAAEAERKCLKARGEAEQRCCHLLGIAYKAGKRSTDREITELKTRLAHGRAHQGMTGDCARG